MHNQLTENALAQVTKKQDLNSQISASDCQFKRAPGAEVQSIYIRIELVFVKWNLPVHIPDNNRPVPRPRSQYLGEFWVPGKRACLRDVAVQNCDQLRLKTVKTYLRPIKIKTVHFYLR